MSRLVLLGPQQLGAGAPLGQTLAELGIRGPVALVTAGWQEREADDAALVETLGVPAVNLRLHERSEEVFAADPELKGAYTARQELLRHLQTFYRVRLEYADDAARAISVRRVEPELLEQEKNISVEVLRTLDRDHLDRCRAIHAAFAAQWDVGARAIVARHRGELHEIIASSDGLVIAGGHVASLLNRLKLFDVLGNGFLAKGRPIVAWSAGAMVLTERIVLFHDYPPYGKNIAQVLDEGFALARGVVVLPDPHDRINFEDREAIARFAQRMAPAACLAFDAAARVVFEGDRPISTAALRLTPSGDLAPAGQSSAPIAGQGP